MNANVRIEEVTAFGDFIMTSYTRDFEFIRSKFPKLDEAFKNDFIGKLSFVKELESSLVLTESQKNVTASLYAEAKQLNGDLNFLSSYFVDAGLNPFIVTSLKKDLSQSNIEGAILKIEGVLQFVVAHESALIAEGMGADFAVVLRNYKESLILKNKTQNELMNIRKELTDTNITHYTALLKIIRTITNKGKLVFKGSIFSDEYINRKVLQRMRAANKKKEG
jgi:hypothetical protein